MLGKVRQYHLLLGLLAIATLAAFHQVVRCDFIDWDDGAYVYQNPHVRDGLSPAGLRWAVTGTLVDFWMPVTSLSFLLDFQLFGLAPWGYHLTNLVVHVLNAVLAFLFFERWTGRPYRSLVVAGLFALHPLRVESVAWVAERKDVLSVFFGLAALLAYGRYAAVPGPGRYCLVVLTFALSLMAKPMLVTLPFLLLLLDYWPLCRWPLAGRESAALRAVPPARLSRLIAEKVPLLLLSIAFSALVWHTQQEAKAIPSSLMFPFWFRAANATISYVRYLGMTIVPAGLALFYPFPLNGLSGWRLIGSAAVLLLLSLAALGQARRRPALFLGWFWYLGTLVPVIGFIQIGGQALADRYTYFPSLGLGLALTWCAADALETVGWQPVWQGAVAVTILLLCAGLTFAQTAYWQDSYTVWNATVQATGENVLAQFKRGSALQDVGRFEEALADYREVLRINTDFVGVHNNCGMVCRELGRPDEAVDHYRQELRLQPESADVHTNYGIALRDLGRIDDALAQFQEALRLQPTLAAAHVAWAAALVDLGRVEDALGHYQEAVRLKPDFAEAQNDWGLALHRFGRNREAERHCQLAMQIDPNYAEAYNNSGVILRHKGESRDAISRFQEALRLKPNLAEAHNNWGLALCDLARYDEAMIHYRQAVELKPAYAEAYSNWGIALYQMGRKDEAVEHYRQAVRLKPGYAEAHNNWGSALQESGRLEEALSHYEEALRIKPGFAEAHINCANVLLGLGRLDKAVAHYREAVRTRPNYPEVHFNWGLALMLQGRHEPAAEQFQQALRLQPDFAAARDQLRRAETFLQPRNAARKP